MIGQHQRPLHQCLHTMIGQHHRSLHQRLHIHHDQTASTFARAVVACTCVSATSTSAATDFNVCRSSGGTYMCVSSINICCVGHQRLQEQWWHIILQQHERLLQWCHHINSTAISHEHGGTWQPADSTQRLQREPAPCGNCGSTACYPIVCMQHQCFRSHVCTQQRCHTR